MRHTSPEFVAFLTELVLNQPRGKELGSIRRMGITTARVLTGPTTRCSMSRGHEGRLTGARIRSPLRVDVDWLAHGSVLSATTGRASTPGPNRRSRRAAMCGSRALGGVVNGYDEVNEKRFLPVVMPLAQIEVKAQTQISS